MKFIEQFIALFHLDAANKKSIYGYFEAILSITVNLMLFVVKLVFGILMNSISLLADAVHSLSDVITSFILIFGFSISAKPPDEKHPFGHGRAEPIVSSVIACLLIVVGFEFFINGLGRFRDPVPIDTNWFIIVILAATIIIKEFLSHVSFAISKKIGSYSLKADAWHHRTDAISTALVILGFLLYRLRLYYVDGIIGMIIAIFIVYMGISIIKDAGSILIGEAPSVSLTQKIKDIALSCGGISDVHHIHVHDYGGRLEITVHIRLQKDTHLDEAHDKASEVEMCLKDALKDAEITVHVEPEYE